MLLQLIKKIKFLGQFYQKNIGEKWVRKKLSTVFPFLLKGQAILDVGCGNGLVMEQLIQKGYAVRGVDVANHTLNRALEIDVYDGLTMDYTDKQFDIALLLTVLHHTSDPLLVLKETARVATGIIIIEDVYGNKLQQYLTYAMDTLVNLGHSSMTYQNKADKEWLATFKELNLQLESKTSKRVLGLFRQNTYHLTTSNA